MRDDIKRKWLYKLDTETQGTGTLCQIGPEGSESFCCWGLLLEIAVADGKANRDRVMSDGGKGKFVVYRWLDSDETMIGYPTNAVLDWAEISYDLGDQITVHHLANMNDNGSNFAFIASEITERL